MVAISVQFRNSPTKKDKPMSYDKWDEYDPGPFKGFCNDCKLKVQISYENYGFDYWGHDGKTKTTYDLRATCTVCEGTDVDV